MQTGQRVEVRIEPADRHGWSGLAAFRPDNVIVGTLVGFTHAVAGADGFIEERHSIVVQTTAGRFIFAHPNQVTLLGSPEQIDRVKRYEQLREEDAARQRQRQENEALREMLPA